MTLSSTGPCPIDDTVAHPHDIEATIPDRLPTAELRELSRISTSRAVLAMATEWALIAAAIVISTHVHWWPMTVLAVIFIGARQHALTVISHDASHFRLLPNRHLNDWVGNLFLAWPMFISVQGFRHYHGPHHRFLGESGDTNRALWNTHDQNGELVAEWRYPKTPHGLAWKILKRAALATGIFWMTRGLVGGFLFGVSAIAQVTRVVLWVGFFYLIHRLHGWQGFFVYWILPYCTWHIAAQYVRLVCEHSAVQSADPRYGRTRSTIPGWLGRTFVLPRNIGYHIEHHFYPSVPFYRLPALHARLAKEPGFTAHANVKRSLVASLAECTAPVES